MHTISLPILQPQLWVESWSSNGSGGSSSNVVGAWSGGLCHWLPMTLCQQH